jgi:hypothetical protein
MKPWLVQIRTLAAQEKARRDLASKAGHGAPDSEVDPHIKA